ncbi:Mu transposase C-terminal domain-containing protein [Amphritea opalescens]|nr:Mu transposase C-terminal domain-containing protein [Amphritea opalescens]
MLPNQKIISCDKNAIEWLIVEVAPEVDLVALTDLSLKNPRRPFTKSLSELQASVDKGIMQVVDHSFPAALELRDADIEEKWLAMRNKALEAIHPIVNDQSIRLEYLFGDSAGIFSKLMKESGRSRKFIATSLNRFFAFGGFHNSLLPQYFMCGKNQTRLDDYFVIENNVVCLKSKPGPKTKFGTPHRMVTEQDRLQIAAFCKKIRSGYKVSLRKLYLDYCRQYCLVSVKPKGALDTDIAENLGVLLPPQFLISPRSFMREVKKIVSNLTFLRKEKGSINYDRDHAGKPGVAREGLRGPTSRYEIDSTVADIYIRSNYSGQEMIAIGRPIVFLVIDTCTTMIVGVHVAFDGPNWHSAGQALYSAMTDKVEFCASHGVTIKAEDWPCHHPCRELTFDRGGENTDAHIEALLRPRIGITAGNFNAYHRGDCKGCVEKMFDLLNQVIVHIENGKVVKNPRKEDQHASRKATVTYDQFMKILIKTIIHLNNTRTRVDSHNFEMSRDGVGYTPRDVWNWGIENAVMTPTVSREKVRYAVLPEAEATVQDKGVYFRGLYYCSDEIVKDLWLDKAKNEGRYKVRIRYTDTSTNHIWVTDSTLGKIIQLNLTTRSEAYKNQIWADVMSKLERKKGVLAEQVELRLAERVKLELEISEIDDEAKKNVRYLRQSQAKNIQPGMHGYKEVEAAKQKFYESMDIQTDLKQPNTTAVDTGSVRDSSGQDLTDPTIIQCED